MQEDRRSLWTETAAAASWFQAPLGILAAGRHIMTIGHQLYAAQQKKEVLFLRALLIGGEENVGGRGESVHLKIKLNEKTGTV